MSNKKTTETTLTQLTKRFVKLLNSSSERVINLNEASTKLSVAKRRIYDITNVLEGIGLLQKTSKNVTRWTDCPPDSPLAAPFNNTTTANTANNINNNSNTTSNNHISIQTNNNIKQEFTSSNHANNQQLLKIDQSQQQQQEPHHQSAAAVENGLPDAELISLLKTYKDLEEGVNELETQIRQQLHADGAYVTYQDIKSFFDDQIVIAVKAPPETRLEVNESLQIWMKSEGDGIEVYLCPQYNNDNNNFNNNSNNTTLAHPPPPPPPPQPTIVQQSQSVPQQQTQLQPSSQPHQPQSQSYGLHYDTTTSGISTDDHFYTNNDPTLSSALSSGEEDNYGNIPIIPTEEAPSYSFMLEDNYTINSLFPQDDFGVY